MLAELDYQSEVLQEWVLAPASQQSENLASKSHETRRIPDPYIFICKNGKLVSPSNMEPVEEHIDRRNYTEEMEFQAFLKIQEWSAKNESGISLWFSPPDYYDCLKIISSELLYSTEGKIIFNRAIVLDVDFKTSIEIANRLSDLKYQNPEDLRLNPIFLSLKQELVWLDVLAEYTNQVSLIKSGEDLQIKRDTLKQTTHIFTRTSSVWEAEIEARRQDLIGEFVDSCATSSNSAFNTLLNNALGETFFECPKCHGAIPSGLGITTCPHCGLTKEQAGSTCV